MRHVIKEVFPDRDGFTLVRPALEEAQLARMDQVPASALRPEFRKVRGCCCRRCCSSKLTARTTPVWNA